MKTLHRTALQAAGVCLALALAAPTLDAQNAASPLGKTNFSSYLSAVPFPPNTMPEAARRTYGADLRNPNPNALDQFYQPLVDRVDRAIQVYKTYYGDRTNAFYQQEGEANTQARATAMANQNPMLAGMGGVEAVSQMSPAEAEAAARRSAAAFQADPFAANGVQSPGMTALYQKIMSDPAYAERFQKMSEKEREAELRKFMANDPAPAKTPAQQAEDQRRKSEQMQRVDKVRSAMAFQQYFAEMSGKLGAIQAGYEQRRPDRLAAAGNHHDIEVDFQKKYAAIPEVVIGETRDKDPEQALRLALETAKRHQVFAAGVLKQDLVELAELRAGFQHLAVEYTDYLAVHRSEINGNIADQLQGTETESLFASFEMSLLGSAQSLVDCAKASTKEAAAWERNLAELQRH